MNFKEYLSNFKDVVDREVECWFYPKDIIITYGILNEIQKSSGDICEIGVAYGKSAIMISQFKGNSNFSCGYPDTSTSPYKTGWNHNQDCHCIQDNESPYSSFLNCSPLLK